MAIRAALARTLVQEASALTMAPTTAVVREDTEAALANPLTHILVLLITALAQQVEQDQEIRPAATAAVITTTPAVVVSIAHVDFLRSQLRLQPVQTLKWANSWKKPVACSRATKCSNRAQRSVSRLVGMGTTLVAVDMEARVMTTTIKLIV